MYSLIRIFILLLSFFIYKNSSAQHQSEIDSLEQLATATEVPYEKAELYYSLAKRHLGVNFPKAAKYARLAYRNYPKDNYVKMGNCYGTIAIIETQTSEHQQALIHIDSSIYFYEKARDTIGLALSYSNKGGILINLEQRTEGAACLYKSLAFNEKIGRVEGTLFALTNLSSIHTFLNQLDKSLMVLSKALKIANAQNDEETKAYIYYSIGNNYFNYKNMPSKEAKFDSALYFYQLSLPILQTLQHYGQLALSQLSIADVYAQLNNQNQSLSHLKKAIALKQYIVLKEDQLEFNINTAKIYHTIGRHQESIRLATTVLDSAKVFNSLYYHDKALRILKFNAVHLKEFEKAYYYQRDIYILNDSVMAIEKQKQFQDLEIQYETNKKEQENILLIKEKDFETLRADRNRQLLYLSILALVLFIAVSFLLMRQYKINAAHLTNQLKHRLLRNQMSPHFIFNSLVAIQNFVYKKAPIQAGEYLASFAELIRAILENSMEEYIPLEKEIQWLDNYLKLQLLRFDNRFEYSINLDESIDIENILIPPMLTQPFIENALEHGLKDLDYKGKVMVDINILDQKLQINVRDNGIGLGNNTLASSNKKHKSLAVKITKERLDLLNKKSRKNIYFSMKNLNSNGTLISFSLPLNYKY